METTVLSRRGWDDWGKLLLRLAVGGLMLFHGVAKLKGGIGWMGDALGQVGLPAFVGYGVYVGEVIAPALVLAGLFTRPAALVISFNMVMALYVARRDAILSLNQGGGWAIELEILFLIGGIVIFLLGAGRFSVRQGRHRWD